MLITVFSLLPRRSSHRPSFMIWPVNVQPCNWETSMPTARVLTVIAYDQRRLQAAFKCIETSVEHVVAQQECFLSSVQTVTDCSECMIMKICQGWHKQ